MAVKRIFQPSAEKPVWNLARLEEGCVEIVISRVGMILWRSHFAKSWELRVTDITCWRCKTYRHKDQN